MSDIVDVIDELVDEQLSNYSNRSGYDHNVNQEKCWHCGEEWHGLAITSRMKQMRIQGHIDEGYRYDQDESEVICPGSTFIGPLPSRRNRLIGASGLMSPEEIRERLRTSALRGVLGRPTFEMPSDIMGHFSPYGEFDRVSPTVIPGTYYDGPLYQIINYRMRVVVSCEEIEYLGAGNLKTQLVRSFILHVSRSAGLYSEHFDEVDIHVDAHDDSERAQQTWVLYWEPQVNKIQLWNNDRQMRPSQVAVIDSPVRNPVIRWGEAINDTLTFRNSDIYTMFQPVYFRMSGWDARERQWIYMRDES